MAYVLTQSIPTDPTFGFGDGMCYLSIAGVEAKDLVVQVYVG